ncbi:hypothetical protein BJX70DRAFT_134794 [Aspergillus crustosus]
MGWVFSSTVFSPTITISILTSAATSTTTTTTHQKSHPISDPIQQTHHLMFTPHTLSPTSTPLASQPINNQSPSPSPSPCPKSSPSIQ